jgi:hypothetical protein
LHAGKQRRFDVVPAFQGWDIAAMVDTADKHVKTPSGERLRQCGRIRGG